jgi:hypothetical protein
MPTVTLHTSVTLDEVARALEEKLGQRYEVMAHGEGPEEALRVKKSAVSLATVHLEQDGGLTKFHVHGGGLAITRMINEFGIAKSVSSAIEKSFGQPGG